MPYMIQQRSGGSRISQGEKTNGQKYLLDACTNHEATYSFRSGSDRSGQIASSLSNEASLSQRLLHRQRQIKEMIFLAEDGRAAAPTHFLTQDIGHEFGTLKYRFYGEPNGVKFPFEPTGNYIKNMQNLVCRGRYAIAADGSMTLQPGIRDVNSFFSSRGATLVGSWTDSTAPLALRNPGMYATGHIKDMNPFYASQASFLTTALELVKGDVPHLLRRLKTHYAQITSWKSRYKYFKDGARTAGGEFLNAQFGWAPIIRDVQAGLEILLSLDRALYSPDDTRRSRDSVVFSGSGEQSRNETWTLEAPLSRAVNQYQSKLVVNKYTANPNFDPSSSYSLFTKTSASTEITLRTTARFATGLAPGSASNGYVDRAIDLLGLRLTPEVLWDLTPWSWMIDWFSNVGTIVQNLQTLGLSNAFLNYAYTTVRVITNSTAYAKPPANTSSTVWNGNFIQNEVVDAKVRLAASPFGFGVDLSSLNASQWSILVALGLARSR